MLIDIVSVKYLEKYKLELTFENNVKKIVDFEKDIFSYDGPVIKPLRDKNYFKTVKLNKEIGTIEWDSGYDCDPSFLYEEGLTIQLKKGMQRNLCSFFNRKRFKSLFSFCYKNSKIYERRM